MSVMRARFEAQVCEPKACVLCSLYIVMSNASATTACFCLSVERCQKESFDPPDPPRD